MDELPALALTAGFILGYGLISARIHKSFVSAPMLFTLFGIALGPWMLDLIHVEVESAFLHTLAELTLVLVLFTDAARIDLTLLRRDHTIPLRLLSIGLPLTILLGAGVAWLLFGVFSLWEAVIIAVILAPTDAALGQAVVSSSLVPVRIRQALNVESGLNDGMALPILLFFVALAGGGHAMRSPADWIQFATFQLLLGPLVGALVAYVGGSLISRAETHHWVDGAFQRLAALGLALLAFAVAELVGGNGFIAAFCAGMVLGNLFRSVCSRLYEFVEAEGQLLTLLTFLFFGAVLLPPVIEHINWRIVVYSLLSLSVVRMAPVALSLANMRLQRQTILFLGWFGPRGIASILYCLLVLEEGRLPQRDPMYAVIMFTVLISIFAHGLTAAPLSKRYAAYTHRREDAPDMPEHVPVQEMPLRSGNRTLRE